MLFYTDLMSGKYILSMLVFGLILASYSMAAAVGSASIKAPAVIITNNTGSLTIINLTITNGNGNVSIKGPQYVASSTVYSARTAAYYASNYTNHKFNDYNFTYYIANAGDNVSGPSAGAAMSMLAVAAFDNRQLSNNFTMTGTILPNGSIGEIGGVYDKASAAKHDGMKFLLVPRVPQGSQEGELYLLVQTYFDIPLVQVANISQASYFAFNKNIDVLQNMTTYKFYSDYNVNSLPDATFKCSSSCNYSIFGLLLNATFNLTRNEISNLSSSPKFSGVAANLSMVLNQSIEISKHNYVYTAADFAFLDYVNAFYFNGYPSNRTSALSLLYRIQDYCTNLSPPPLTTKNYNYVISAELRQLWGNYTINQVISSYNTSQIESDQILDELYAGAQSNGWCTAANLVYKESAQNGTYVAPSDSLRTVAYDRIQRALPYGDSLYLETAQQAYKEGNYPVAILDADYAYALSSAALQSSSSSISELNNMSMTVAGNATFGVWATEFSNEAQFYVSESKMTANNTLAKTYSQSAYSVALLAQQISNDTKIINDSFVVVAAPAIQNSDVQKLIDYINFSQEVIIALLALVIVLLIINIVFINTIVKSIKHEVRNANNGTKRKRR